jgi:hypothetical protein
VEEREEGVKTSAHALRHFETLLAVQLVKMAQQVEARKLEARARFLQSTAAADGERAGKARMKKGVQWGHRSQQGR